MWFKEAEEEFIGAQKDLGTITLETETAMRYAFSSGARKGYAVGWSEGRRITLAAIHRALGILNEEEEG